jgi:hypothetical protein
MQFPSLSCPAQAGHPVHTDRAAIAGSSAFADDDRKEMKQAVFLRAPMVRDASLRDAPHHEEHSFRPHPEEPAKRASRRMRQNEH